MRAFGKFLNVKDCKSRVSDCFTEYSACFRLERSIEFVLSGIRTYKCNIYSHFLHGHGNEVKCSTIDGTGSYNVASALTDIEKRIEIGCLSAACKHCGSTTLEFRDFGGNIVIRRILQSCIEITACLKIKQLSHILACVIFESCALDDRNLSRFTVARCVSTLNTFGIDVHNKPPKNNLIE